MVILKHRGEGVGGWNYWKYFIEQKSMHALAILFPKQRNNKTGFFQNKRVFPCSGYVRWEAMQQ